MNEMKTAEIMFPFFRSAPWEELQHRVSMVYGRPRHDYQRDCLVFKCAEHETMDQQDVALLRANGFDVCYVYDMLDLENREFTEDGFLAICSDIERAIAWGYSHIMVSNGYLIELVLNEYGHKIKTVISSLLECNSDRAKVFFDVLNDVSSVSHIVLSQNHLTPARLTQTIRIFGGIQLTVEVDRWCSDLQMIHEHYYNVLYGYYNADALRELRRLTRRADIVGHIKSPVEMIWPERHLNYKVGDLNSSYTRCRSNLNSLLDQKYSEIRIVDLDMWQ